MEERPDPEPGRGELPCAGQGRQTNGADMLQRKGGLYPAPPGSPRRTSPAWGLAGEGARPCGARSHPLRGGRAHVMAVVGGGAPGRARPGPRARCHAGAGAARVACRISRVFTLRIPPPSSASSLRGLFVANFACQLSRWVICRLDLLSCFKPVRAAIARQVSSTGRSSWPPSIARRCHRHQPLSDAGVLFDNLRLEFPPDLCDPVLAEASTFVAAIQNGSSLSAPLVRGPAAVDRK